MTGKLQSDPLEARFGCYRQLNGANFFISLRQVLDSEKKIRVLNMLKDLKAAVDNGIITSISSHLPSTTESKSDIPDHEYLWLTTELRSDIDSVDDIPVKERNVIYYVSGYIGRSLSRANHCDSCKSMLLSSRDVSNEDFSNIVGENETLLSMVDRGGLSAPSEVNFSICVISYSLFQQLVSDNELFKKFLGCHRHESVFISSVAHLLKHHETFHSFLDISCNKNHKLFKRINAKLFHCYMKNIIRQSNPNKSHTVINDSSQNRKVKKLCSKS